MVRLAFVHVQECMNLVIGRFVLDVVVAKCSRLLLLLFGVSVEDLLWNDDGLGLGPEAWK